MLSLALWLAMQDLPAPTPAMCRVAGERVGLLVESLDLYRSGDPAFEAKRDALKQLREGLIARFGKAPLARAAMHAFDMTGNDDLVAYARTCAALPR